MPFCPPLPPRPRAPALVRVASLAPSALTRGFVRHVGIPLKRYLGALRLPLALAALRARLMLDAALDLDLAPSRLDSLMRAHTDLTSGEWRRQGERVGMRWGVHPTPLGPLLLRTPLDLSGVGFAHAEGPDPVSMALAFLGQSCASYGKSNDQRRACRRGFGAQRTPAD
jgi:AraC family transcriptional regulator of adaptative response/methylated-DNA-[protein]-cysteine methyltransferase